MKLFVILLQVLVFGRLGLSQDINDLKLSTLAEVLRIVKKLDIKTEAIDARLDTLEDQVLKLNQQMEANQEDVLQKIEGGHCGSSNTDLLIETFADIFEREQQIQRELANTTCTKDQVETLQYLLATDECFEKKHNCSSMATCEDVPIGFKCNCQEGYSEDGVNCQDVDECLSSTSNCSSLASCTNSDGGFECSCLPGYTGDGLQCQDIDECLLGKTNCSRDTLCSNTEGSYECSCHFGFSGDGVHCTACPSNFIYGEGIGCMHVGSTNSKQVGAKLYCSLLHEKGRLIVPDDFESLQSFLSSSTQYTRQEYWVGIENRHWLNGDPVLDKHTGFGLDYGTHPLKCAYVHKLQGYKLRGNSCNHSFIPPICGLKP